MRQTVNIMVENDRPTQECELKLKPILRHIIRSNRYGMINISKIPRKECELILKTTV